MFVITVRDKALGGVVVEGHSTDPLSADRADKIMRGIDTVLRKMERAEGKRIKRAEGHAAFNAKRKRYKKLIGTK